VYPGFVRIEIPPSVARACAVMLTHINLCTIYAMLCWLHCKCMLGHINQMLENPACLYNNGNPLMPQLYRKYI
jgi:hypothetical protein